MAYQPIQLPTVNPLADALQVFAGLQRNKQAKEAQRQQIDLERSAQQQRADQFAQTFGLQQQAQKRQDARLDLETQWKRQEFEQKQRNAALEAIKEAQKYERAGLPRVADSIRRAHQINMEPQGGQPAAVTATPTGPTAQQPQAAPTPQGGSPLPDGIEFGQPQQSTTGPVPQDVYDQTVTFGNKTQNPETHALNEWYQPGGPPPIAAPSDPQQPQAPMSVMDALRSGNLDNLPQSEPQIPEENPILAAYSASKDANAARAAQLYKLTGPGGIDLGTYDPNEAQQASLAQAQQFRQQMANAPDAAQYVPMISSLIAGGTLSREDAGKQLLALIEKDKQLAQAREMREAFGLTREDRLNMAKNRDAALRAQAGAGNQFKGEGATDRVLSIADRAFERWKGTVKWDKILANDKTVRALSANLEPGSLPLNHKDAQIQLARFFRGAMPTEGEMHMLYSSLGGSADKFDQWKEKMLSGDLSREQMRQLKHAADTVIREHEESIDRSLNSARKTFAGDPSLSGAASHLNSLVQGAFEAVGRQVPDIFTPEEIEGSAVLGSGTSPWERARKAERDRNASRAGKVPRGGKPDKVDAVMELLK